VLPVDHKPTGELSGLAISSDRANSEAASTDAVSTVKPVANHASVRPCCGMSPQPDEHIFRLCKRPAIAWNRRLVQGLPAWPSAAVASGPRLARLLL